MSERCETCRFGTYHADKHFRDAPGIVSEPAHVDCRRYPPKAGGSRYGRCDAMRNNFPRMFLTDWCGEYQPKDTSDA